MATHLKLVTWNTAARKAKALFQCDAIKQMAPDVLALQEVTQQTLPLWQNMLPRIGLPHIAESLSLATVGMSDRKLRYVQLTASRYPLVAVPEGNFEIPWPERVLTTVVSQGDSDFIVHNAYIPTGSGNGWIKIETLEGIFQTLGGADLKRTILCGDFNTPQDELPDGTLVTWAQRVRDDGSIRMPRSVRKGSAERWDAGERNVLRGIEGFGEADVFRRLHGYGVREESWKPYRKTGAVGRRFDLIFASTDMDILEAGYIHRVRHDRLSDHSAAHTTLSS